jgi:pre-rRNA-processing protein IPI1
MAKSKKKKEKKADFAVDQSVSFIPSLRYLQKTKLKVGKTKPKPANYTDTSFKFRSITP